MKQLNANPVSYDIHGILTVESDVALPELEPFHVPAHHRVPDIQIQLRNLDGPVETSASRSVTYKERLGNRGFAIRIELGQQTRIVASPFLRTSPHVLYTNAVEPVLRWAFVRRGYALVHGACLVSDDRAFIITARTDTGKTTTMLKTLDAHPDYAFVSDDLTLLQEDGSVFTYPKPLTISRHTLHAVNTPLLTRTERSALFFQSRLHSKSGRSFGLLMTQFNLPMATFNAVVQRMVPPPKYPIQRLIPHARLANTAKLSGVVVIERGEPCEFPLSHLEAVSTLLANSDDSYGFPPYDQIKEHLYLTEEGDLRDEERRIVTLALETPPTIVMRSQARTWYMQIPEFIRTSCAPVPFLEPRVAMALEGVAD